MRAMTVPR